MNSSESGLSYHLKGQAGPELPLLSLPIISSLNTLGYEEPRFLKQGIVIKSVHL